jgi:hypothetical protein
LLLQKSQQHFIANNLFGEFLIDDRMSNEMKLNGPARFLTIMTCFAQIKDGKYLHVCCLLRQRKLKAFKGNSF